MKIKEVIGYLEEIAPLHLQEEYDNAGLLVGNAEDELTKALICLDSTEAIVMEAVARGCNMVIAHHPIIFRGLRKITGATYIERAVIAAIRHNVALYAIHTNLDNVLQNGVNQEIGSRLDLQDMEVLQVKDVANSAVGSGVVGRLPSEMTCSAFADFLKERMQLQVVKHTTFHQEKLERIALCGGSGRFLLDTAINRGADAFISSDFKYHEYFDANGLITVFDIGHYESERFTIDLLNRLLHEKFRTFAGCCAETNTNPITYR